jgi:hypothetical protein
MSQYAHYFILTDHLDKSINRIIPTITFFIKIEMPIIQTTLLFDFLNINLKKKKKTTLISLVSTQ